MFHATQVQSLFDCIDELNKLDLSALPEDIKEVVGRVLVEKAHLAGLEQRLVIGVRDTRSATVHYPILLPKDRSYDDADFMATFDTSSDTSEDYTYVIRPEDLEVKVLPLEGEL
ncbi:TPA: hypothetical protein ACP32N_005103 [Pseudomonas aeruginosa]